jgi:hypothetical protein
MIERKKEKRKKERKKEERKEERKKERFFFSFTLGLFKDSVSNICYSILILGHTLPRHSFGRKALCFHWWFWFLSFMELIPS